MTFLGTNQEWNTRGDEFINDWSKIEVAIGQQQLLGGQKPDKLLSEHVFTVVVTSIGFRVQ